MATMQRFSALWRAHAVRAAVPFLGYTALAGFMLAGWSSGVLAQPALPNQLEIKAQGISIRYPAGWSIPPKRYANVDELVNVPAGEHARGRPTARVQITAVPRTDHAEALRELRDIATENNSKPTFLDIGGWPGLQRRHTEPRQQPSGGPLFADKVVLRITTAVAVGNLVVRAEAFLPSAASATLISEVEAMGQSLKFKTEGTPQRTGQELEELRRGANVPPGSALLTPHDAQDFTSSHNSTAGAASGGIRQSAAKETPTLAPQWPLQDPPLTRLFQGGNGELEIAVSPNGRNIVVARQRLFRTSNDGGQTFAFNGAAGFGDGDPSLAWGQSGNFYLAGINTGCTATTTCTGMDRSTNNGQTFPFLTNALSCPNTGRRRSGLLGVAKLQLYRAGPLYHLFPGQRGQLDCPSRC